MSDFGVYFCIFYYYYLVNKSCITASASIVTIISHEYTVAHRCVLVINTIINTITKFVDRVGSRWLNGARRLDSVFEIN